LTKNNPDNSIHDDVLLADLHEKSDAELRDVLDQLYKEEKKISYQRRILHGKIDILKAELVERLKQKRKSGESLISGKDIEHLTKILAQGAPEFPEVD
jgi:hypothetical protein